MTASRHPLFTEPSQHKVLELYPESETFGPSFGNRRANRRRFRQPWGNPSREACASPVADEALCDCG